MPSRPHSPSRSFCLTGGIAAGKSKVASWFSERNWGVVCSDEIVHRLYQRGEELPRRIARLFGEEMLTKQGEVDRKKLGDLVFQDESALRRLNALVHPFVRQKWEQEASAALLRGKKTLVVIPLAFEAGLVSEFEETWVVACSEEEQRRRMRQRGLDDAQIRNRLSAQGSLQKKIDGADLVIWNTASWPLTEEQLEKILCRYE